MLNRARSMTLLLVAESIIKLARNKHAKSGGCLRFCVGLVIPKLRKEDFISTLRGVFAVFVW